MILELNEEVSVVTVFDADKRATIPIAMKWRDKKYKITRVAFTHPVRLGRILHHVFSVTDGNMDYRLDFNTENQHWTLQEASDGITD